MQDLAKEFARKLSRGQQCCSEGGLDQKMIEGLERAFTNRGVIR